MSPSTKFSAFFFFCSNISASLFVAYARQSGYYLSRPTSLPCVSPQLFPSFLTGPPIIPTYCPCFPWYRFRMEP